MSAGLATIGTVETLGSSQRSSEPWLGTHHAWMTVRGSSAVPKCFHTSSQLHANTEESKEWCVVRGVALRAEFSE